MTVAFLRRYQCPKCGGGLSRTYLYPRSPVYELQFPSYRVPVVRICVGIVAVGLALALVHVALAVLGILAIGAWVAWTYYGPLQCDNCGTYYISGQFAGGKGPTIPWRTTNTKEIGRRIAVVLLVGLAVFAPIYLLQAAFESRCSKDCASQGLGSETWFPRLHCQCVSLSK
jgi:hypothetical protein